MLKLRIQAWMRAMPKWRLFAIFVTAAAVIAGFASALTYLTVLSRPVSAPARLALIAPMSGANHMVGEAMRAGVTQWLAEAARRGGPAGHPIDLVVIDEAADPDAARTAAADPGVIGVVGPFTQQTASQARPVFETAGLPALTFGTAGDPTDAAHIAMFEMASRPLQEVQFLANYIRNVLGERLVSVILQDDDESKALADGFDEVLQRFGTRVVYRWAVPAAEGAAAETLRTIAVDIANRKIAGTILVLGPPRMAARALAALRDADVPNRVAGPRALATGAFLGALAENLHGGAAPVLNGTVVTTPVLFDTAGIGAQGLRDHLVAATGRAPDWTAVLAYEAAAAFGMEISSLPNAAADGPAALRSRLRAAFAAQNSPDHALRGLIGPLFFDSAGRGSLPELVGAYDGAELVSAPTQLSPIREQGAPNYLDELSAGRALYVNDRFMYKTSVVYAGVRIEKVLDLNVDTNVADLEFVLWLRWRGTLDPQNVTFPNAVTPITLGAPEREGKSGDINYRAYRVRGKFFMNFSDTPKRFGMQAIEVIFRHRLLSRNNLQYVTDALGMGLTGGAAPRADRTWLQQLLGSKDETSPLTRQLTEGHVLAGTNGWLVDHSWLSQEFRDSSTNGDPLFVGFGKPAPTFSTIGLGMVIKADALDVTGAISTNWLVYIAIFALSMSVLAHILDRKDRGYFWRMQTLVLRLAAWPTLLATVAALALDYAQETATPSGVQGFASVVSMLWWVVPARLLMITIERFIWVPLELNTGRKVPTVFRMIVATLIYALAGLGMIAFVLGKSITSLLATSGVLTMIIGLAFQSNLRDIISGIMLNLEQPFAIGDFVRVGKTVARVIDVSWRTTRLETSTGSVMALPNGKLSESEIENMTKARKWEVASTVMVDPSYNPELIVEGLREAGKSIAFPCKVKYADLVRVERIGDAFAAVFMLTLETLDYETMKKVRSVAPGAIWQALVRRGVSWNLPHAAAGVAAPDDLQARQPALT